MVIVVLVMVLAAAVVAPMAAIGANARGRLRVTAARVRALGALIWRIVTGKP